jgi:hypothetical protein
LKEIWHVSCRKVGAVAERFLDVDHNQAGFHGGFSVGLIGLIVC